MASGDLEQRYDLTARIAPFLDPLLAQKLVEYAKSKGATVEVSPETTTQGIDSISSEHSAEYARKLYEKGEFTQAAELLGKLRAEVPRSTTPSTPAGDDEDSEPNPRVEELTWGKLAAEILARHSNEALEEVVKLQEILDQRRSSDALVALTSRTWLAHWSLFAYFWLPEQPLEKLVETWFQSQWMSTIQASSPWLLRYLAVAVISGHPLTARHASRRIKDLVRSIAQELYEYTDPVLDFVRCLFVDYDFAVVSAKLQGALDVLKADFYISEALVSQFETSAKFLIADLYLRVHDRVSVATLANMLGSSEEFVTGQYADTKADAEVDAETRTIRLAIARPSVLQIVTERAKAVDQRTHQVLSQVRSKHE